MFGMKTGIVSCFPKKNLTNVRERIIVPLDRHFIIYPGGAGVDEGDLFFSTTATGVDEVG